MYIDLLPSITRLRNLRHHVLTCQTSSDADYAWGLINHRRRAVIEEAGHETV